MAWQAICKWAFVCGENKVTTKSCRSNLRKIRLEKILKNWIGKWVMFVSIGHIVVGSVFYGGTYRELAANGFYNSVNSVKTGLAVWFALFGVVLFVVGMLIFTIEKHELQVSQSVGITLLLLTIVGILLMPVSGFWLMFPAIFAIFYKRTSNPSRIKI